MSKSKISKNTVPSRFSLVDPAAFNRPLHHLAVRIGERSIPVVTDFAVTPKNSKVYGSELVTFIKYVETDCARRRAAPKTLGPMYPRY